MWVLGFWIQLLMLLQQTLLCTKTYIQSSDFCFKILPHQKRTDGRGMERGSKTNTNRQIRYLYGKAPQIHHMREESEWPGSGVVCWLKVKLEPRDRRLTEGLVGLKRGGSCITQKMGWVALLSVITKCKEETCLLDKNMVFRGGVRSLSKD